MASKLSLYNDTCLILGERRLANLTERRPIRYALDATWDGGWVKFCLEQGLWNFAMKDVSLTYSPSITPSHGFQYAFDKPADWCRTFMVARDGTYRDPILQREDQGSYWFADDDTIYARFVSSDSQYGGDLSLWPEKFTQYAAHYGAWKNAKFITGSNTDKESIERAMNKLRKECASFDATNEVPRPMPRGTWSTARAGGSFSNDRGPTGSLT